MKTKTLGILCILTLLFASCEVNEELCEKNHPHTSGVQFKYVWDRLPAAMKYDAADMSDDKYVNMYIIADRVINNKTYTFSFNVKSAGGEGRGHYLYPVPDPIPDPLSEGYTENANIKTFEVSAGEYKFLSMSYDRTFEEVLNPSRIITENYIITPNPLNYKDVNMKLRLGAFTAEHRTYTYEQLKDYYIDSPFSEFDGSVDSNPYTSAPEDASEEEKEAGRAKFIKIIDKPIVIDSTVIRRIGNEEVTEVDFHSTPITQNIDLYFDLKKKQTSTFQFYVSDVWCVLSGIPRVTNVGTGAIDISKTDKLIYRTKLVDPNTVPNSNSEEMIPKGWPSDKIVDNIGKYDNQAEDMVRCYANLNIPGIVENTLESDANKYVGPGVLQVIIKVQVYEKDPSDNRWGWTPHIIMGRVNLHKNIERAQLLELYNEKKDVEYWRKAQDYKSVYLAIDAILTQSLIMGTDESPRVANWEEEQYIDVEP